jgi:hypothetical protein
MYHMSSPSSKKELVYVLYHVLRTCLGFGSKGIGGTKIHFYSKFSTILKAPVSTVISRHLFTKKSLYFFQINSA